MTQQTRWLHSDTVAKTNTLGQNRWENYTWTLQVAQLYQTQLTGQLAQIPVDRTITLQEIGQDVTLGHRKQDRYVRTLWMEQLYQDTVDGTVTIGHSRQNSQLHMTLQT